MVNQLDGKHTEGDIHGTEVKVALVEIVSLKLSKYVRVVRRVVKGVGTSKKKVKGWVGMVLRDARTRQTRRGGCDSLEITTWRRISPFLFCTGSALFSTILTCFARSLHSRVLPPTTREITFCCWISLRAFPDLFLSFTGVASCHLDRQTRLY